MVMSLFGGRSDHGGGLEGFGCGEWLSGHKP